MAKKKIRKSIRINGKKYTGRFTTKEKADAWYAQMYNRKSFAKSGISLPTDDRVSLNEYFDTEWFPARKKEYRVATHASDKQRYEDYLRNTLGPLPISKITAPAVAAVLKNLVVMRNLAPTTRDRVRALISAIFSDAISRETPLATVNPTYGLKFKGKRTGAKAKSFLVSTDQVLQFLGSAKVLGKYHLASASFFLMTGVRKQEFIAMQWDCVDFANKTITIKRKYLQSEKIIVNGTKRGEETARAVPMSKTLERILREHKDSSKFKGPADFVFGSSKGKHLSPRNVTTLIAQICRKAGIKVTVHGLRHTFGREFAEKSANFKALQELLGHSNIKTTEGYSELGAARLQKFGSVVEFDVEKDGK